MIKKEKGKYIIVSKIKHKKLGTYHSRKKALERMRQIEYFKHKGK